MPAKGTESDGADPAAAPPDTRSVAARRAANRAARRAARRVARLASDLRPRQTRRERPVLMGVRINRRHEISARLRTAQGAIDPSDALALFGRGLDRRLMPLRTRWAFRGTDTYAVARLPGTVRRWQAWSLVVVATDGLVVPACADASVAELDWSGTNDRLDEPLARARVDRANRLVLSSLVRVPQYRAHAASFGIGTARVTWLGDEELLVLAAAAWSTSDSSLTFAARPDGPGRRLVEFDLDQVPAIDTGEWVCFVGSAREDLIRLRSEPGVSPRTDRTPHTAGTWFSRADGTAVEAKFRYTGTHQLCLAVRDTA